MKYLIFILLAFPSSLFAIPRNILPSSPSEIWQNDLDLNDQIKNSVSTTSLSGTYLTTSSATATYLTNSSATLTYLTNSSATITYLPILGTESIINNIAYYTTDVGSATTVHGSYIETNLSTSITPSSTNSKILICAMGIGYNSGAFGNYYSIFRGSTNLGAAVGGLAEILSTTPIPITMFAYDSPNTTNETTYSVRMLSAAGTVYFGNVARQAMILIELK